jgi:hypothetical protein
MTLNGTWHFSAQPADVFFKHVSTADPVAPVEVPGEWAMQGLEVLKKRSAGYRRTFTLPADWSGQRVILRADAIYSEATFWINGAPAGSHLGGFTPAELDITSLLRSGENLLAIAVRNDTVADALASGTRYAGHPLGGITRKIRLFAVPPVHPTEFLVNADWDPATRAATITLRVDLANGGPGAATIHARIAFDPPTLYGRALQAPAPAPIQLDPITLAAGDSVTQSATIQLPAALPWHTEHPHLYRARLTLVRDGAPLATFERRFGCRRVEVRGHQLFVNGAVQKLFGVNRHETHPLYGRSLREPMWREDVARFRAANVNLIRTCHYPPAEELFEAADELGVFVECEGPFCWSHESAGKFPEEEIRAATVRQNEEMGRFLRHHPSILFWSVANESNWNEHFAASSAALRRIDPTRPQTFEYVGILRQPTEDEAKHCEIGSTHYPGPTGPEVFRNYARPVNFGEYCHLNAYNRRELATDPGVRDAWGPFFSRMVDDMRGSAGVAGGSIWAGLDDTFVLPPPRTKPKQPPRFAGYGSWGPLDGWRREKPEYWHMKKAYAPVRIRTEDLSLPAQEGGAVEVEIENRFVFTNLRDLRLEWLAGNAHGTVGVDIAPGAAGRVTLRLPALPPDTALILRCTHPNGDVVDEHVVGRTAAVAASTGAAVRIEVNPQNGELEARPEGRPPIPLGGPHLAVLPLMFEGDTWLTRHEPSYSTATAPCTGWKPAGPVEQQPDAVVIRGRYQEAEGAFTIAHSHDSLDIRFAFTLLQNINPRQIGLVFDLPRAFDMLAWSRKGLWTLYPGDHIGRLAGSAIPYPDDGVVCNPVGPMQPPAHAWRHDTLPHGCNDFISTKHNILRASLRGPEGALQIESDGSHHVRAWVEEDRVRLLVATYANAGSEHFHLQYAKSAFTPLEPGMKIEGAVRIRFAAP